MLLICDEISAFKAACTSNLFESSPSNKDVRDLLTILYCLLSLNKNVVFTRKGTPCALTGVSLQQLIDTKLERFNTIFSFIPNELKNKYGSRLIREAAYCGNDEIVLKLSDSIPKKFLNKADQNGRTVMHFASRKCAPETLIYLIKEKGAFFKNPDLSNRTPLHHASIVGIKAS